MSTIAKRLREIVATANETTKGAVMRAVLKVAVELEAVPAADAVQPLGDLPEHVCGSTGFGLGADDVCAACQWWRRKWVLENKTIPYADHLSAIDHWQKRALEAEAQIAWLGPVDASHAADAVPVVARWTWYSDDEGSWELRGPDHASLSQGTEVRLIPESAHLSAIAALQARLNAWVKAAAETGALLPDATGMPRATASTVGLQAQIATLRAQAQHAEDVVEAAKDRIDELTAELEARQVPNREAFEMWFSSSRRSRGAGKRPTFLRLEDGSYADGHAQRHWWTWQCALAAPSNPTTQPPEGR